MLRKARFVMTWFVSLWLEAELDKFFESGVTIHFTGLPFTSLTTNAHKTLYDHEVLLKGYSGHCGLK